MRPPATTWTVPARLAIVRWPGEDEVLVFHEASGNLHLLTRAAAAVLDRLTESPATADQLVANANGLDPTSVRTILETLDRFALISPVEP